MDSPKQQVLLDRKTFFIGLVLACVVIVFGYYVLNRVFGKHAAWPGSAQKLAQPQQAPPPAHPLPSSPFVKDLQSDAEAAQAMAPSGATKVVLVHAPWCGHCRQMMGSFLEAASQDNSVEWIRVDGNAAPSLVRREDLRGFPTLYGVSADGKVSQHMGPRDTQSLLSFAKKLLAPPMPVVKLEEIVNPIEVLDD
jgi:thioredoxin-like negative regulator of GroEL